MTIIVFLLILAVLIVSHEFGHFWVAKRAGVRVDEFGLGFPPRLFSWKKGETTYSLNLLPFGGFVKIFGEDVTAESPAPEDAGRSLTSQSRWWQAAVLLAGVTANFLLAWILISGGFLIGLPTPVEALPANQVANAKLIVTGVLPGSPAARAGLLVGDEITTFKTAEEVTTLTAQNEGKVIVLETNRGALKVTPEKLAETGGTAAIGISLERLALWKLSLLPAIWEGGKLTVSLTGATVQSLGHLIWEAVHGADVLQQITGPVGLAGLVGSARRLGLVYLLNFAALISINLAVINLVPFPALDGGRLLFLIIEKLRGGPLPARMVNVANLIGFGLLILLMLVVGYHDIVRLLL